MTPSSPDEGFKVDPIGSQPPAPAAGPDSQVESVPAHAPPSPPGWLAAMPPEYRARTSPPTKAGPMAVREQPPRWPGVIGGVSLGLGILGIVTYATSLASSIFAEQFIGSMPGQESTIAIQRKWLVESVIANGLSICTSTWLILASVALFRRSRWARPMVLSWCIARIIIGIGTAIITALVQRDQMAALTVSTTGPGGVPGAIPPGASVGVVLATGLGFGLWVVVWPVFMLVWFNLAKVKQHCRAWSAKSPPNPGPGPHPGAL